MNSKHVLSFIFIVSFFLSSSAAASNWIPFTAVQQNGQGWYYDKDSIVFFKAKKIIGVEVPKKDMNYQRMWIKSSTDTGEKRFQVELNCEERSARLQNHNGKTLYSESSIDYLYDRPIPPDTVLDALRKAVCRK